MEVLELKTSHYLKRRHVDRRSRRCNQEKGVGIDNEDWDAL